MAKKTVDELLVETLVTAGVKRVFGPAGDSLNGITDCARVEYPEELGGALKEAFAHYGPALIDVVSNRQDLSMPPTIELKQALGFSLYMAKAVLNGRGDEVIDLAKTTLFRHLHRCEASAGF
jgi:thiamine pyrophosphate-dependent acetolactate synthase large subunit-like protein